MHSQAFSSPHDSTIRLFRPPAVSQPTDDSQLSPSMPLSAFYRQFIRPVVLRKAKPRNLETYEQSIKYWIEFTGDPPLAAIDERTALSRFLSRLEALPGLRGGCVSPRTVHKHCRTIQRCLDLAGPRSRATPRLRMAQNLIDDVPYLEKPELGRPEPSGIFTLDEIGRLYQVAQTATTPRALAKVHRPTFWRSLFQFDYNCPLRVGSLVELRWEWIEGEWLSIPGWAYKGGQPQRFWLNEPARQAVEAMRPITAHYERVFPWLDWHRLSYLHQYRRQLLMRSGIPRDRWFGFKGLRKASLTATYAINPDAAQLSGGHTTRGTTEGYYVAPAAKQAVIAAVLQSALSQLPQPIG